MMICIQVRSPPLPPTSWKIDAQKFPLFLFDSMQKLKLDISWEERQQHKQNENLSSSSFPGHFRVMKCATRDGLGSRMYAIWWHVHFRKWKLENYRNLERNSNKFIVCLLAYPSQRQQNPPLSTWTCTFEESLNSNRPIHGGGTNITTKNEFKNPNTKSTVYNAICLLSVIASKKLPIQTD